MVFKDRVAKYPGRWTMKKSDGSSEVVTLIRNDEPTVEGTPMNAETLNTLSDVAGADIARQQAERAAEQAEADREKAQTAASTAANDVAALLKGYTDSAFASKEAAAASQTAAKTSETESAKNLQGTKEYFEQVRTITIGAQGWYATPEALKAAVPVGENGWWAVVGTTDTIWTWDSDTGAWVDTRKEVDLSDYLTQTQIKALLAGYMPLRAATTTVLGGIKVGDNLSIDADGKLNGAAPYALTAAKVTAALGFTPTRIISSTSAPPGDVSAYPDGTLWITYSTSTAATSADEAVDDTDIHIPDDETGGTDTTDTAEPPVLVDADGVPEEG